MSLLGDATAVLQNAGLWQENLSTSGHDIHRCTLQGDHRWILVCVPETNELANEFKWTTQTLVLIVSYRTFALRIMECFGAHPQYG